MNIVVLCSDSFRADVLDCYGDHQVHTPNLDKFASQSIVFENAYTEGLPTIPARKIYFTGRRLFPRWELKPIKGDSVSSLMGWNPLLEEEITLAEILQRENILTGLITDVYHYFKPAQNLHRYFDSWQWIRGQEADPYRTGLREVMPKYARVPEVKVSEDMRKAFLRSALHIKGTDDKYLLNISKGKEEEDYFVAQVMLKATEWLEDNAKNSPFLLWVDCFDPHEPWDPPKKYADMYYPDYEGLEPIFALSRSINAFSFAEQKRIKALYFGEVTLVDKWIGKVLEKIKSLGLEDDTVVIFTSDHGTILGELGRLHKGQDLLIKPEVQLPLIIHYPDGLLKGKRITGVVQSIDLMPTLLDILDVDIPDRVEGHSFLPLMKGEERDLHPEGVITAFGDYVSLRDKRWNYINRYRGENAGNEPQLFNLEQDPKETKNTALDYPEVLKTMQDKINEFIVSHVRK